MAARTLDTLPNEIVQNILRFLPPKEAIAFAQTSRQFLAVTYEPQLWRYYCFTQYRHWDEKHRWSARLSNNEPTHWRKLYGERQSVNHIVAINLDSILGSQSGRIHAFRNIAACGYDAKEVLAAQAQVSDDVPDSLARRYWSKSLLDHLHRRIAVQAWVALRNAVESENRLERCMSAFDLFILDDQKINPDHNLRLLDQLVESLLKEQPDLYEAPPRIKALAIAAFLKGNSIVGIHSGREFHHIEHNFLGLALSGKEHNSLPLVSVVIYCYIARALGLRASPCGFPLHVHAIVRPPEGFDLQGRSVSSSSAVASMFIDPFGSAEEVHIERLHSELDFIVGAGTPREPFLEESDDVAIIIRCARNILNSLQQSEQTPATPIDLRRARYASVWASMILSQSRGQGLEALPVQLPQALGRLIRIFAEEFRHDASLIQDYLLPAFENHPDHDRYTDAVAGLCQKDTEPKGIKDRTTFSEDRVKYQVGQVFQHRRYGYNAVIVGWDIRCEMREEWIQLMHVDQLRDGRNQCFYKAVVDDRDRSSRYVAEENIRLIEPDPFEFSPIFMFEAGQYFKKWDPERSRFVSNLRDEYPED